MNLAERLIASSVRLPEKPALRWQGTSIPYVELARRVRRGAGGLLELGLRPATADGPGDRVALLIGNSPHFVEAFHAIVAAGLVAVPVNVAFTPDEVAHILADSGARAVVVSEPFAPLLDGLRETLPELEEVILTGTSGAPLGAHQWRYLVDHADEVDCADLDGDAIAVLQYTSGTTGSPKGAMLSHRNLMSNQDQMLETRVRVEEGDVVLCALPLFHIYALNVAMALPLARGSTVLLLERFDALQSLREIERERVSIIVGAPPMFVAWLNTPGAGSADLASVRYAVSGASPLPPDVLERFRREMGIGIYEGYGLTETSPLITSVTMAEAPRPGSVGRPVPGVELRIADESGAEVRDGDPGEVLVRGPNVFGGYWGKPEATAQVLDDEGWLRTGDIGYLADDHLYLVDRKKDLVIVSGFNVYPREVEEVLARHPKVDQAAVVGMPHPYTGEAVKAVVVLAPGEEATAHEIIDFCSLSLARFKCPEVVEFVTELPALDSGKVLRRALREDVGPGS